MKMFGLCAAFAIAGVVSWASADTYSLVDQPADQISFFPSYDWGTRIQAGDDLVVPPGHAARITGVSFTMVVSWPNVPRRFSFEIYRTVPDDRRIWRPLYRPPDFTLHPATRVIDRGEWTGGGNNGFGHTLHEVEVTFDNLDIVLEPGISLDNRWFFSPVGHITDPREQISYWATAGGAQAEDHNWSDGWWRSVPFTWPGWRLVRWTGDWATHYPPPDFAMTLEGEMWLVPTTAELTDLEFVSGEWTDGWLRDLRESDDDYLVIWSEVGDRASEMHRTDVIVSAETDVLEAVFLDLTVEARLGTAAGAAHVALRNWSTNDFDEVLAYPIGSQEESHTVPDINAADYISDTGAIDVRIRHIVIVTFFKFSFDSLLDHLVVIVRLE